MCENMIYVSRMAKECGVLFMQCGMQALTDFLKDLVTVVYRSICRQSLPALFY